MDRKYHLKRSRIIAVLFVLALLACNEEIEESPALKFYGKWNTFYYERFVAYGEDTVFYEDREHDVFIDVISYDSVLISGSGGTDNEILGKWKVKDGALIHTGVVDGIIDQIIFAHGNYWNAEGRIDYGSSVSIFKATFSKQ